ncbi:MAG: PilZ domain-containing protein [Deltaproteobacteria bacterium]|nr:PilZ domain-containing protein [Deltaproteobacteria bacterium]
MTLSENRRRTRVRFNTLATLIGPEGTLTRLVTSDISLNSLHVESEVIWDPGTRMEILLHLTGASSNLSLRMEGRVIRAEQEGMAIEFSKIDIDSFFHLRNIISLNSGEPEKIDRELATESVY